MLSSVLAGKEKAAGRGREGGLVGAEIDIASGIELLTHSTPRTTRQSTARAMGLCPSTACTAPVPEPCLPQQAPSTLQECLELSMAGG